MKDINSAWSSDTFGILTVNTGKARAGSQLHGSHSNCKSGL